MNGKILFLFFSTLAVWPLAHAREERMITDEVIQKVAEKLILKHGQVHEGRIRRGLSQVATFWREEDGSPEDFEAFCQEHFVSEAQQLETLLARFDRAFEALWGHEVALTRTLREPLDLDTGPILPIDLLLGSLNPFDHLSEDLYRTKVAFVILLNFPLLTATEIEQTKPEPTRQDWASIRLAQIVALRIPGEIKQEATRLAVKASHYIDNYNIYTSKLRTPTGDSPFPGGPKLISHWGLRDHIKALYADSGGNLEKQRILRKVMERIVLQEIPAAVINNEQLEWDPIKNIVLQDGKKADVALQARENDERYAHIIRIFEVERKIDKYSPLYPTYISRQFDYYRNLPETVVERLLLDVLEDPVANDVAALIRERLRRRLEPHDIWYDGFKARSSIPEEKLNARVREQFPTLEAFKKSLPSVLERLGFSSEVANFLAERIAVDPARGAGHAMGAGMRSDLAHLRTRVPAGGMDYKGYNIAMHELGHTVEQTFSLQKVDRILLNGVPNTAFTEAIAFLFQERDLMVLGLREAGERAQALQTLDTFWSTREIAGVALVEMRVWRWLYEHPEATPAQLREIVLSTAKDVWNRYYAPVMKTEIDSPILAIYSHMIAYPLYLPDYPLGHLIHFQIEEYLEGKSFGSEIERMYVQGRISPQAWMTGAVGKPLSARPLLEAAQKAIRFLKRVER